MLQKMEVQLKAFLEQLNRVKDLDGPEFGGLPSQELNMVVRKAICDSNSNDPLKSSQVYVPHTSFLEETKGGFRRGRKERIIREENEEALLLLRFTPVLELNVTLSFLNTAIIMRF